MSTFAKRSMSFLLSTALSVSVLVLVYFFQPVIYQGSILLSVDRPNCSGGTSESMETIVEQFRSDGFIEAASKKLKRTDIYEFLTKNKSALLLKPSNGGDSIKVSVTGTSYDLVRSSLVALVDEFKFQHKNNMETRLKPYRAELNRLELESQKLKAILQLENRQLIDKDSSVLPSLILERQQQLNSNLEEAGRVKDVIRHDETFMIRDIVPLSVTKTKYLDSIYKAITLGVMLGFLIQLLINMFKNE